MVGEVSAAAEAETENKRAAVQQPYGYEFLTEKFERAVQRVRFELWNGRLLLVTIENIGKATLDSAHRFSRGEDRNARALAEIIRPHIIEPHQMVGVGMREQHGIQPVHFGAQHLGSKIWSSIDHHVMAAIFEQHGWTQTVIARVVRIADVAMTAGRRHAHAGTRSQHRDF